jgi:DNA modification methylase
MSVNESKFELRGDPSTPQPPLPLKAPEAAPPRPAPRRKDSARLVWDSKPKRPPSPRDIEFQTAEVVIPNPARDAGSLPFTFRDGILHNEEIDRSKMNRLIWGDNLLAMQALLASGYEGKIDLIYIDPPFDSKADYSLRIHIGNEEVTKEPSVIERLAYRDTWEAGIDSYLDMLYPRLQLMRRLLADSGAIFVHLDSGLSHYVRAILDETFGRLNFRSEIVVKRRITKNLQEQFENVQALPLAHDVVFWYSKSQNTRFPAPRVLIENTKPEGYWHHFWSNADRPTMRYDLLGVTPRTGQWKWQKVRALQAVKNYEHYLSKSGGTSLAEYWQSTGKSLEFIRKSERGKIESWYPPSTDRIANTLWLDIHAYENQKDYPTQKHGELLQRILETSKDPKGVVADFFCGSGTTLAIAERAGRPWIGSDFGKVSVQVTRNRLVQQDAKPFLIENIGNYQREMIYLSGGRIGEMQRVILKLYGATPHPVQRDLGVRTAEGGVVELIHVGYPDRPTHREKSRGTGPRGRDAGRAGLPAARDSRLGLRLQLRLRTGRA